MCIYHALISAQSAHMIHINLNTIFYTHVEHSPTKTTHTKHPKERPPHPPPTPTHRGISEMNESIIPSYRIQMF